MTGTAPQIVLGVDPARPDAGAVTLAGELAGLLGARVVVTALHPRHGGGAEAQQVADRVAERLADGPVATHTEAASSPARGLVRVAERRGAVCIVLGAAHHVAGVTGRVLNGAPCAVAVAPRGHQPCSLTRIGVAFADTPEGRAALRTGWAIAGAAGAELRVVSVIEPLAWTAELWPEIVTPDRIATYREREQRTLQAAIDETCGAGVVRGEILEGRVEALERASEQFDLLVCGSRGYGPAGVVILGSVSHALAHYGRCPVLVLPRSPAPALEPLLRQRTRATATHGVPS